MTLDELVLEWSYRTQRGYPSMDSPSDILVLKQILKELDLPTNLLRNLGEVGMRPADLRATASFGPFTGERRIDILIRKIENDEELELDSGGTIIVANKDEVIDTLKANTFTKAIPLTGTDGTQTTTSKLRKTPEFGGQDKVSTDPENLKVRTDTKESLVILMCNILFIIHVYSVHRLQLTLHFCLFVCHVTQLFIPFSNHLY